VVEEAAGESELARRIYDSYMTFYAGVKNYHRLTEQAYLEVR
jgi:hypothetical protein